MKRVALITGGAKGIGRAIGEALAADGWSIAICYRSSEAAAEEACGLFRAAGVQAIAIEADVSRPEECKALIETVMAEFGRLDALFNCAGPYHRRAILEETFEGWHEMFDNNLHPVFYLGQEIAPILKEQGWGRIVNFSMAGADRLRAQPFITAHYIAKSGILILTQTLA
ncbi:MAG: 3-oxoacyl-[acyl-carrier protein] reductase, partial [Planctomycetota bacterium]